MSIQRVSSVLCVSLALLTVSVLANSPFSAQLPPVTHADTETTTNVAFAAGIPYSGKFALSLECLATPSNNVQVAFGTDANANGVIVGKSGIAYRRREDGVYVLPITALRA